MTDTISKDIDPARVGISKSLITTPCERQGYYKETVRDASGRRLSFPMPERVIFGKAVDVAHGYIVERIRDGERWTLDAAVTLGLAAAERDEDSYALVEDKATFAVQVENAMTLFTEQPDGLERLRPLIPGIRIQGDNGASLSAPADDGTPDIGTPDYWLADGSILDVKTTGSAEGYGRAYDERKFWNKGEMAFYSHLVTSLTGALPPRLIYQVYVRQAKPRWQWIEVPGNGALVTLGRLHSRRWRKGFAAGDPDLFGHDLSYCGECPYREAIAGLHDGCPIGQARVDAEAA